VNKIDLKTWVAATKERVKNAEVQIANQQVMSIVVAVEELLNASGLRDEVLARLLANIPKGDEKIELAFLEALGDGAYKAGTILRAIQEKTGIELEGNNYLKVRVALEAKGLIQRLGEKSGTIYLLTDAGKVRIKK
jgi:hypothetical protein